MSSATPPQTTYGRLHPTGATTPTHSTKRRCRLLLLTTSIFLLAAASVLTIAIAHAKSAATRAPLRPTKAITRACGLTRYPSLCMQSLVAFPGALSAGAAADLVPLSVNLTLRRFGQALSLSSEIGNWKMDSGGRAAYDDCMELLDDSVDLLATSLVAVGGNKGGGTTDDVMTWLSAAMTNHETCTEGLTEAGGAVRAQMDEHLQDLSELVSNALALYAATYGGGGGSSDFSGVPIKNRRLMAAEGGGSGLPAWMSRSHRELLEAPAVQIQADVVVSKGGGAGTVATIAEAIKKAPEQGQQRFIIHVTAGKYVENNLKVGRKKTNLWFIGDGRGKTVISGSKNVLHDKITTFHTASFAATGTGFVAKDISFVNEAGPGSHQAVALRVGADHAVVYRCEIKGYQDTLYTHSQRQFYRDCDISGTVDFIFGNAAVVFQHCNIYSRKPMDMQKVTITAQNRKDPNQNTGMSIHACQILAAPDLAPVKASFPTFLGRPWKVYSRVVYMLSYLGDHVDPSGWLEWNSTQPVDKLYYGEFMNTGPRADTSGRVKWPGVHSAMSKDEASKFTVAQFIYGAEWLTATGVAFQAGLTA